MALIFGIQFFHTRVTREIRGSAAFGIYQLRFAWDFEIGIGISRLDGMKISRRTLGGAAGERYSDCARARMALIFGIQFFHIRVIREIRGSAAFGNWQLEFPWDLEIGIWNFRMK
jgi:hypothetical protein